MLLDRTPEGTRENALHASWLVPAVLFEPLREKLKQPYISIAVFGAAAGPYLPYLLEMCDTQSSIHAFEARKQERAAINDSFRECPCLTTFSPEFFPAGRTHYSLMIFLDGFRTALDVFSRNARDSYLSPDCQVLVLSPVGGNLENEKATLNRLESMGLTHVPQHYRNSLRDARTRMAATFKGAADLVDSRDTSPLGLEQMMTGGLYRTLDMLRTLRSETVAGNLGKARHYFVLSDLAPAFK